jgi:hypothetical protein
LCDRSPDHLNDLPESPHERGDHTGIFTVQVENEPWLSIDMRIDANEFLTDQSTRDGANCYSLPIVAFGGLSHRDTSSMTAFVRAAMVRLESCAERFSAKSARRTIAIETP